MFTLTYEMSVSEAKMLADVLDTEEWDNFTALFTQAASEITSKSSESISIQITVSGE